MLSTAVPSADEQREELRQAREDATSALTLAAERMKEYYDRYVRDAPEFKDGQKYAGPYLVKRKVGNLAYELKLPKDLALHPVFHVSLLLPHKESQLPGRHPPEPASIEVEGEEEYEVEEVLESRRYGRWKKLQYLVHWMGWGPEHDSWEDAADLANAPKVVQKFHSTHPDAPSPLNKKTKSEAPFDLFDFVDSFLTSLFGKDPFELTFNPSSYSQPSEDDFFLFNVIMGDVKPESIPLLHTAAQYPTWAGAMRGFLIMCGAWEIVIQAPNTVDASDAAAVKARQDLVHRAAGVITMHTHMDLHHLLLDDNWMPKEPHIMWQALKKEFGTLDAAATWGNFEALIGIDRLSNQKPLRDQFNRLEARLKDITDGGLTLGDDMKALLVLSKIPESYRTLISGLLTSSTLAELTVDMVVTKTLAKENVRKTGNITSSATRVSTTKPKKKGPCGHCGGKTHDESSCWKKYPDKKPKQEGRNNGKGKGKDNSHAHTIKSTDNHASVLVTTSTSESSQSILASHYTAAPAVEGYNMMTWMMDSGASEHITFDMNDFSTYKVLGRFEVTFVLMVGGSRPS
ncbi:hypothetical protein GSI_15002 [Ganoderma sinense ZZ0214-1]|uniref:Chromo domain-containing protein n=1 Tax=Ganoderma sinense ZZ0214-1 TaxID=1077348 RepID=A0A2G8RLB4_9APHY|nr:hypothetical protein GSI_15002 [Ganoderma sinense ZZ0214-1]